MSEENTIEDMIRLRDALDEADMPTEGRLLWVDDKDGGHIIGDARGVSDE